MVTMVSVKCFNIPSIPCFNFLTTFAVILTLGLLILKPVFAADNFAIEGYDPVAYFTLSKAVEGKKQYSYKWDGETWLFISEKHRKMFVSNPGSYAPQFNGFCANGLSDGHAIGADPRNWRIIDGKLYLFFSEYGRDQWEGDVKFLIQRARETLNEH